MTLREKIDKVLEGFLVLIMSILVIDVLWQVTSRYVLSCPSSFTDELAGFLVIWVSLFGAAYVTGKNEHLAIDLMLQNATPKRRKLLETIINVSIVLFGLFVLVIGGIWLVYTRFALEVKSAALQLPLGYVYIVLPISGLLIVFYSVDNLYKLKKADTK